ncbi:MAG: hypothetical protein AAF436_16280 [Myxococcota bacterium]
MRLIKGTIVVLGLLLVLPGEGRAHPLLDDGIASYERADFASALRMFNAAAREADLSVDELLQLYEMRALLHHATGNWAAMLEDLRRVVALDPTHELSRLAPPPVRKAFGEMVEMQGPSVAAQVVIDETRVRGATIVVASVVRVPDGLVDHTTLRCGVGLEDKSVSATAQGTRVELPLPTPDGHNGCEGNALSRRGEVLFRASVDPSRTPGRRDVMGVTAPSPPRDRMSKKKRRWILIATGLTVAVAGGVTAGVLLSKNSQSGSEPGAVTVNW